MEGVCTAGDYSITQMATNEMLHKVPGVQFSFSDDNTILSESIERAVNVIADSVCSVLLDTIIKGIVSCTNSASSFIISFTG